MDEEAIRVLDSPEIKQEPIVSIDEGAGNGDGGGGCSGAELPEVVAKPMEELKELEIAPFLRKIYAMVDDPDTDSVVSWTLSSTSFVVWDPYKLSTDLLPKYFKHGNFSSFVRQLNTYGFKKMEPERWEYANEGFVKGQRHLLKTIKRRAKNTTDVFSFEVHPKRAEPRPAFESIQLNAEKELRKLRDDCDALMMDILKVKEEQKRALVKLESSNKRLKITELKQVHLVVFVSRLFRIPLFLEKLIKKNELAIAGKSGGGGGEGSKKRRVAVDELVMNETDVRTLFSGDEGSPVEYTMGNEGQKSGPSSPDYNSENFILWEKLLEDDMIFETETAAQELAKYQSKFAHGSKDLNINPQDLKSEVKDLLDQLDQVDRGE